MKAIQSLAVMCTLFNPLFNADAFADNLVENRALHVEANGAKGSISLMTGTNDVSFSLITNVWGGLAGPDKVTTETKKGDESSFFSE